ncbi:MAG: Gfo/Idh/MocA family protein [Aureliella sp.]
MKAGIVGVGFMGWIHYLAYVRSTQAHLQAFCSRNAAKREGDWTSIQGNFGPPGEKISVDQLDVYESLDDMLENSELDLIDICLPPNMHVDAACKALEAGKHVLCEKPLGLNTEDCDQILNAAAKYGKKVMVAQVLPYMGEFQFIYELARGGELGDVKRAHLKRAISPPDWISNFYQADEVGGPLIDLHVHDIHFARLLLGMPKRVCCTAEMKDGIVKYGYCLLEFSDGRIVSTSSGVSDQNARPFCHGFEIQFERGLAQFELSATNSGAEILPLMVFGQDGELKKPELKSADEVDAFTAEIDDAVRSIGSEVTVDKLDGAIARDAIHICQCLQRSAETGDWVDCST